jgi:hypothetical protein
MNYILQKDEAQKRYDECKKCEKFITLTKQCSECFCFMPIKVKIIQSTCPLNKWPTQI